MNIFERKPVLRWVAPLAFVAVLGGTTGIVATATAEDKLAPISAEDLLVKVQNAKVDTLSGTVVQDSNLGLPSLPGVGSDDASLTSLLSGTHTLGVWHSGPDKARLQVQGTNDETDVIVNGKDVWQWSYKDNTATHRTLTAPTAEQRKSFEGDAPADLPKTPEEAAQRALDAVAPTTQVTTDGTAEVAGIQAYELVLTPKDDNSLVTQVRIAVDGTRFIPLRVQVIAGAADPVFQVAYSNISFDRPDDAQFTFKAPPGAEVKEIAPKADQSTGKLTQKQLEARKAEHEAKADDVKVVGQGWSSVVVAKTDSTASDTPAQLDQVKNALPEVSGTWGKGRLLSSAAFSAVVTDDGRIAVGSVKPELLYDALAK
jgi:outer membrane lipoprotein-sorting protein